MHVSSFPTIAAVLLVLAAPCLGSLSEELLTVTNQVATSEPATDIDPFASKVKANAKTLDKQNIVPRDNDATNAAVACSLFKLLFPQKYSDKKSSDYTAEVEASPLITVWQNSTCFFKPANSADVAFGLKIVTLTGSKFATRSGGHSQNPGWNAVKDGVVFDMAAINKISINTDHSLATVGAGQRWGPTYDYLDSYGKAVAGGRAYDVGVSGLLIGTGINFLTSSYGFSCDNVDRWKIVLPNSTIVNANSKSHSDLWRAQKGGGPNYGIITEVDLYTIDNKVWYKIGSYPETDYKNLLTAIVAVQQGMEKDSNAGIIFAAEGGQVTIGLIYKGHVSRPAVFAPFDDIVPTKVISPETNGTIAALSADVLAGSNAKTRYYSRAMSYKTDLNTYLRGYEAFLKRKDFNQGSNDTLQFGIQGITAAAVQQGIKRGGNWLGSGAESTNWWHAIATWHAPDGDKKGIPASVGMFNEMTAISKQTGKYVPFVFMNDAAGDQPSPLASYGASNLAKMKAVAKAYDPMAVMQNLQNGGFKLSQA